VREEEVSRDVRKKRTRKGVRKRKGRIKGKGKMVRVSRLSDDMCNCVIV
jgi:predicted transcriptional regulator